MHGVAAGAYSFVLPDCAPSESTEPCEPGGDGSRLGSGVVVHPNTNVQS